MADKNPNQIDINLALMSGQSGLHFEKFVKELSQISKTLDHIAGMSTRTEATQPNLMSTGGASHGGSATQQQQVKDNQKNQGKGGASSGEATGEQEVKRSDIRSRLSEYGTRLQRRLGDHHLLRESESNNTYRESGQRPASHQGGGGGGASHPRLSNVPEWAQRGLGEPVEMPRFGALTLQDKIKLGRNMAARWAYDPDTGDLQRPMLAKAGEAMDFTQSMIPYIETARSGFNVVRNSTLGRAQALQTYGTQTMGYQREGVDVPVPGTPFGFQLPFSQLFTSGGKNALVDKATQAWISAQAGISKDQVKGIYENLYGRGYVHGDGRDKMLSSLVSLTKKNPGMDLQRVGELQDSAARFGAESLERFNETLNKVPDIAHAANLNVNEFLAHMDELGKQFAEMGGSDAQGQNYAVQFTQATGMPATIGGALLNNTFVQSQLMSRTGLLPQQQALAGSSMLFQSSVDAAQQMVHMYSGFSNRVTTDKFGIHHSVSGDDQAIAMAASQMGIPPAQLKALLHKGKQKEVNNEVSDVMRGRQSLIDKINNTKGISGGEKEKRIGALLDDFPAQQMMKAIRSKDSGFSSSDIKRIDDVQNDKKLSPSEKAKRESGVIKDILNKHEKNLANNTIRGGKNHITIELGDNVKQFFKVLSKGNLFEEGAKVAAHAGEGVLNDAGKFAQHLIPSNPVTDVIGGLL
jgi:hypothetical protein